MGLSEVNPVDILSDITVHMKYARYLPEESRRETWEEVVTRNKQMHLIKYPHLKDELDKVYQLVYDRKVLPSMRSLQFAGKPIDLAPNRIFNCSFLPIDSWKAFHEIMFLLLGGTGVGYSVQFHHVAQLPEIRRPNPKISRRYLIGDSIEGWSDAIKVLMRSYFEGGATLEFDFGDIRPKGARLITSGGKAPGPAPLKECLVKIKNILDDKHTNDKLSTLEVHDIICHIADAVLAGGIRRAALIALFSADDNAMLSAKSGNWWELNPQRGRANNSAVLLRHRITKKYFKELWQRIQASGCGEPGIFFTNDKSWGTNPCGEVGLRPFQMCNLCEANASNIKDQEDLNERVRAAAFIGTLQAGYTNFHYLRNIWRTTCERDALLGVSMTGIATGLDNLDLKEAANVVKRENVRVANLIGINPAARTTCVKPSGNASCVLGTSSGIHAWHSKYYIRRARINKSESLYHHLAANHPELIVDDYFSAHNTAIIEVPQEAPDGAVTRETETATSLLSRINRVYNEWVLPGHRTGMNTHNISATVSVKEDEWDLVGDWMWDNRKNYTGVTVLPYDAGSYVQPPFESCTREEFIERVHKLREVDLRNVVEFEDNTNLTGELACAGGACEITFLGAEESPAIEVAV